MFNNPKMALHCRSTMWEWKHSAFEDLCFFMPAGYYIILTPSQRTGFTSSVSTTSVDTLSKCKVEGGSQ